MKIPISKAFLQLCAGLLCLVMLPFPPGPIPARAEKTRYTCGMHPMIVVDHPGLCPICEMALTPMKEGQEGGTTQVIRVDPVTSQKMGIRTAEVTKMSLYRTIQTVGLADYEEPGQHAINSRVSGWVEKLAVNQAGQMVRKGQPLLEIYSPELVAAQKELLIALANEQKLAQSNLSDAAIDAKALVEAARQRLGFWEITPAQIKHLEESGHVQRTLTLFAPYSGVVSTKNIREGAYVKSGQELMEISSLKTIWIYADIYEDEIPWVKVGQTAEIRFPFLAQPVCGTISTIYPYLDATTRTVKARIDLPNTDLLFKPDMYADIAIETEPKLSAMAIPVEAVLFTGREETVFVDLGQGRFEPRQVRTGLQDDNGYVEILSGLKVGERVVTSAQFMLDSESKLREAIRKMLEPAAAKPASGKDLDDLF